jgi:hypothetical protein
MKAVREQNVQTRFRGHQRANVRHGAMNWPASYRNTSATDKREETSRSSFFLLSFYHFVPGIPL